jgi:hypothetical protein
MIVAIRRHDSVFDSRVNLDLVQGKASPVLLSHKISKTKI